MQLWKLEYFRISLENTKYFTIVIRCHREDQIISPGGVLGCFNRREKKEQYVLEVAEVLQAVWKPFQSTLMDDSGWIYAANGPTTPSELGDRAFPFKI